MRKGKEKGEKKGLGEGRGDVFFQRFLPWSRAFAVLGEKGKHRRYVKQKPRRELSVARTAAEPFGKKKGKEKTLRKIFRPTLCAWSCKCLLKVDPFP